MSTDIYTTHKKLNETLGIDGIVPEMTNKWFKDVLQQQDPQWGYHVGERNPFYGHKHSEETKKMLSEVAKARHKYGDFKGVPNANKGKRRVKAFIKQTYI